MTTSLGAPPPEARVIGNDVTRADWVRHTLDALHLIRELRDDVAQWREIVTITLALAREYERRFRAAEQRAHALREEIRRHTAAASLKGVGA
jgi:hypothetical protein